MSKDRFVAVVLDREDMRRRGRIGGFVTASRYDGRELTAIARDAFRRSFESKVDPDGALPPEERARRAEAARRAHYVKLARASVLARSRAASDAA